MKDRITDFIVAVCLAIVIVFMTWFALMFVLWYIS